MTRVTVATCLLISVSSLSALDPRLTPAQYLHVSWTQEQGNALPEIRALAQTADGYLWLGTDAGLVRFDGMRFVPLEAPSGEKPNVLSLLPSADGGLWIRTLNAITRLYRGRLVPYPQADRWLAGSNHFVSLDHAGNLWLVRVSDPRQAGELLPSGELHIYGAKDGLPDRDITTIFEDGNSRLWITTDRELCRWSPGHAAACMAFPRADILAIPGHGAADLLIGDPSRASGPPFSGSPLKSIDELLSNPHMAPRYLTSDRDGSVWIGTLGQGLIRVAGGKLERFTRSNGLSSDDVRAILEDREHDLWVATARGLDRLRDPQVLHLSTADGLSNNLVLAVAAAADGGTWVGTAAGLDRAVAGGVARYVAGSGSPNGMVLSLCEDPSGILWTGTTGGFGYYAHGRFNEVRTNEGSPLLMVFAIARDPRGPVWLADGRQGLFTVHDGAAERASIPGLQTNDLYQLHFSRAGVLWIGYFHGGVAAVHGDGVERFTSRDGLAGGAVQAIAEDRSGSIWVGAPEGLSRFRNGVWTTWGTRQGVPEGGICGMVEDEHGWLWFMSPQGLSRLNRDSLNPSPRALPQNLEFTPYGQSDGERLAGKSLMANPRCARSSDGRLWFGTENGVAIVDPERIRTNRLPPPVAIEEMVVDGNPLDIAMGSELPFRGRHVHIRYTGLSLMVPERVRFKYILEGSDRKWTDARDVRTVDYVNLWPGHYRFRVQASNNDGVWNLTGASLAFRIEPYFYQTTWFAALCASVLALMAWAAYRMRVRVLVMRYEAIASERARLTRELHDSLLQGFVAVVYQLEAAARQIVTSPEAGKQRLGRAIEQADQALGEARRTMLAMRLPALESHTLPEALWEIAHSLIEGSEIRFHLDVKGRVRQLPYEMQANVFVIAREAIANAVTHARPARILAGLAYSAKQVRLTVEDDGDGFDVAEGLAKEGHWGMTGMRERANQMGATFSVSSSPGRGTIVELVVPSKA
jgi:signal transduction histidine kinase/streptogramin lyase